MTLRGKDFMLYFEYDTGNGIINLPYCSATTITLETTSDLQEVTKPSDSKWKYWENSLLSYTLQLDGLVSYSLQQVKSVLLSSLKGLVKDTNGNYIQVGQTALPPVEYAYYDLETRLLNWLPVKWIMKDLSVDYIYYKGECVIGQASQTISSDDFVKGSIQMRGQGAYERILLPAPINLKYLEQTDAPSETATIVTDFIEHESGESWDNFSTITGNFLVGGIVKISVFEKESSVHTDFTHTCIPGDTADSIFADISEKINSAYITPTDPPPSTIYSYVENGVLHVIMDYDNPTIGTYTNTTQTVKIATFSFDTITGYSEFNLQIINNTDDETYYINSSSKLISTQLATGKNYTISVMGYNSVGLSSDYSSSITIDF